MQKTSIILLLSFLSLIVIQTNAAPAIRRNPLNGEKWEGGFDVQNEDYWLSLLTVVVPGFVLAILSFAGFLIYFLVRCCCCMCGKGCCPQPRSEGYEGFSYALPLILILVVGTLSIVGGIIIFAGGATTSSNMKSFFDELIDIFLDFVQKLTEAIQGMMDAEQEFDNGGGGGGGSNSTSSSDTQELLDALVEVKDVVVDNREYVDQGFKGLNYAAMGIGAAIIVLTVIGFLAVLCRMKWMLNIPIIFVWLLLFFTWSIFGFGVLFETVFSDLCAEMEIYKTNPEESTITKFIPCPEVDPENNPVTIFQEFSNGVILDLNQQFQDANTTFPGTANVLVCPPYTYLDGKYEATQAPSDYCQGDNTTYQVTIEEFGTTTEYDNIYCAENEDLTCPPWKIKYNDWQEIKQGVQALVTVKGLLPFIEDVFDCDFVDTIIEALLNNCKPVNSSIKNFYVGFAVASSGMILSLIFYLAFYPRFSRVEATLDHSYSMFKSNS